MLPAGLSWPLQLGLPTHIVPVTQVSDAWLYLKFVIVVAFSLLLAKLMRRSKRRREDPLGKVRDLSWH